MHIYNNQKALSEHQLIAHQPTLDHFNLQMD